MKTINPQYATLGTSKTMTSPQAFVRADEYFFEEPGFELQDAAQCSTFLDWITPEHANAELDYCNSYTILPKLLEMHPKMESYEWLNILGENWSSCDNTSGYIEQLLQSPMGWGG
jgi:hypothetical protein